MSSTARPCPLCLQEADRTRGQVVVGLYTELSFATHVLRVHPDANVEELWNAAPPSDEKAARP